MRLTTLCIDRGGVHRSHIKTFDAIHPHPPSGPVSTTFVVVVSHDHNVQHVAGAVGAGGVRPRRAEHPQ